MLVYCRTKTGESIGPAINPPPSKQRYVRIHPNESAISADGRWLAFFDSGLEVVRLYDARWADELLEVPVPAGLIPATDGTASPISRLWFSPDGARVNFAAAGKAYTIAVPRFEVAADLTGPLIRFVTVRKSTRPTGSSGSTPQPSAAIRRRIGEPFWHGNTARSRSSPTTNKFVEPRGSRA